MVKKTKKVIVAMSGGVDSSVTAALLKRRGFEVEGVYMRFWKETRNNTNMNTKHHELETGEKYARAVAEKLGIPFRVLDFRKEFKEKVVDYFLREFAAGRTPNPCVACNLEIKFGLLFNKAMEMGADYIATGHYARIGKIHPTPPFKKEGVNISPFYKGGLGGIYKLFTARDKTKDQSYFLYNLTQKHLKKILFPLGDYKKTEVYKMAEKWQLPYKKGESVDICFLAGEDHRVFLRKYLGVAPGKIINTSGKVLGEHQGLIFYTIGQRADIGGPGPFYVVELDSKNNLVVVTNNPRDPLLYKKSLVAENVNWVAGFAPKMSLACNARIRYRHAAVSCTVNRFKNKDLRFRNNYETIFKSPQRAITPGQSVVFYKRDELLGGGIIS